MPKPKKKCKPTVMPIPAPELRKFVLGQTVYWVDWQFQQSDWFKPPYGALLTIHEGTVVSYDQDRCSLEQSGWFGRKKMVYVLVKDIYECREQLVRRIARTLTEL